MYTNSIVIIKGGTNYGKRRNSSKKGIYRMYQYGHLYPFC